MKQPKINILEDISFADANKEDDFYGFKISGGEGLLENNPDCCHFQKFVFDSDSHFSCLDCIFEDCDLSNLDLSKQSFFRVIFQNCKLTGTSFSDSHFKDCQFINCVGNYISFSKGNFEDCLMKNCNFSESSFLALQQKKLKLDKVNFSSCDIMESKLDDVDISTCELDGILIDSYSMKNLVVSQEQAIMLSQLLGLKIKE